MRLATRMLTVTLVALVMSACQNPLGRQYEYEEQVHLKVTGGATITVDSSIAALVALRGAALDPSPLVRVNQEAVRKLFERGGCKDVQVGQPWRRKDRWFIHVRIEATDIRQVSQCSMLGWSSYVFEHDEAGVHYEQTVGAAAGMKPKTNWDGSEIVAFRLQMPSRILEHNVRSMEDEPVDVERGNILTWEQTLNDRRAGKPVHLNVRMEPESILRRTLTLFAGSFVAAIAALAGIVWLTARRGRARAQAAQRTV